MLKSASRRRVTAPDMDMGYGRHDRATLHYNARYRASDDVSELYGTIHSKVGEVASSVKSLKTYT